MVRYPLTFILLFTLPYDSTCQKKKDPKTTLKPTIKGNTSHGYELSQGIPFIPWVEAEHDPSKIAPPHDPSLQGSGYKVPHPLKESPDFRLPEPPFTAYKEEWYREWNRPYRISPHHKMTALWASSRGMEKPHLFGCYCSTAFKRLIPLATCAVLTSRHIITTATSTELVLKKYDTRNTLENILGFWYDHNGNYINSSMYATPSRIHIHPNYMPPDRVNRSHPLPCVFDIAVWASTYRFYGGSQTYALTCQRGGSHLFHYTSTTPKPWELLIVIGYQFVWDLNRKPNPWTKYAVKVRVHSLNYYEICPKVEWGWFHCIYSISWARYGLDSGAMLHAAHERVSWRYDGLIGMNTISMKLRSAHITHYFMVLDTHRILDFLYSGYTGRLQYRYLDYRFDDTQFAAPRRKPWYKIYHQYRFIKEPYWKVDMAWN